MKHDDVPPHPWKPAHATTRVRDIAKGKLDLVLSKHAKEQMQERDLATGDVLYVLKNGFIYDESVPSTRPGFSKYKMECTTPNSNNRTVRLVVIPCASSRHIKVATVMWADEPMRGGCC